MRATIDALRAQTRAAVDQSVAEAKTSLATEIDSRRDALAAVRDYLMALQASERDFDRWFTALKTAAGSHASAIPPPPVFPTPPTPATVAELFEADQPRDFSAATARPV